MDCTKHLFFNIYFQSRGIALVEFLDIQENMENHKAYMFLYVTYNYERKRENYHSCNKENP